MRRSKSDPSKYARNYRRISQRRMIDDDDDDADAEAKTKKEMDRLRTILRESQSHLLSSSSSSARRGVGDDGVGDDGDGEDEDGRIQKTKKKRRRRDDDDDDARTPQHEEEAQRQQDDQQDDLLSPELRAELQGGGGGDYNATDDQNALLILPSKKKKKQTKAQVKVVQLTPEEIRQAKLTYKSAQRKLAQLQSRLDQKRKRQTLYDSLAKHAVTQTAEKELLLSSSTLGQTRSKREELRRLVRKERAGLRLTDVEKSTLYRDRRKEVEGGGEGWDEAVPMTGGDRAKEEAEAPMEASVTKEEDAAPTKKRKKKKKKKRTKDDNEVAEGESASAEAVAAAKEGSTAAAFPNGGGGGDGGKKEREVKGAAAPEGTKAADERRQVTEEKKAGTERKKKRRASTTASADDEDEAIEKAPPPTTTITMENTGAVDDEDENDVQDGDRDDDDDGEDDAMEKEDEFATSTTATEAPAGISSSPATGAPAAASSSSSFAAQIMAGLTTLKRSAERQKAEIELISKENEARRKAEEERIAREKRERLARGPAYVPQSTTVLQTAATLGLGKDRRSSDDESKRQGGRRRRRKFLTVHRPSDIQQTRYDLPVCAMEYEIIDAVRSADATILCGETGSGKSTQVPQFLYEAGLTLGDHRHDDGGDDEGECSGEEEESDLNPFAGVDDDDYEARTKKKKAKGDGKATAPPPPLLIGVTQPRRVAAISTAKRVCYEMGHGTGTSIRGPRGRGNLVAYQTRYESAGLGSDTRIKFMTDGILLQEIRNDLLLRKYGAIVLDEAHERNLNTDVLLGLLSKALPLRRKAAEEGSMPPLKLIVMSATLRVDDFAGNPRLFAPNENDDDAPEKAQARQQQPAVVTVPGRMHPVTVHHSKVTELDDYETAAFNKVCKIHRKLPPGGILVFLTGKQEIVRMVNRLRKTLGGPRRDGRGGRGKKFERCTDRLDVSVSDSTGKVGGTEDDAVLDDGAPRDMDDDEVDGDLFQRQDDVDDYDDAEEESDVDSPPTTGDSASNAAHSDGPQHVTVLPLYSMLSAEEQAKVFAPVQEGHRLIIVATNIAETSITIPGISYVVDPGRQKCRNFHAGTGVASYDVMWISKAAADQRAGRAGRTGPGHCYRLYSSSLYDRHLDQFALPEVLTRPLEDVVLAMKAMHIENVAEFPFPTAPDRGQLDAAVRLLANIGCVDTSMVEERGGDGRITRIGAAVAKLPLGVRYGKMLLIAAQANVLDYAIAMVAVLSESSPFARQGEPKQENSEDGDESDTDDSKAGLDEIDRNAAMKKEREMQRERRSKWIHKGGDVLAGMLAAGAYSYAGRGAGGASEKLACREFCTENGLNLVVMQRIHKMRLHLAKLARARLGKAGGVAAVTGGILSSMPPPNKLQENLLKQAIVSGLLDNVARRAPPGSFDGDYAVMSRAAFLGCNESMKEPLYIDRNSALYSKDVRKLPEWICFDSIVRKTTKAGSSISTMRNVTPLDPSWLAVLSDGSRLLSLGAPLDSPLPRYDPDKDAVMCSVVSKFGSNGWLIPPLQVEMYSAVKNGAKQGSSTILVDDSFRWFARFLLEGKVLDELKGLSSMLNDDPAIISRRKPVSKVTLLVSELSSAGVDSASALRKHWAEKDNKFLFKVLKSWTKKENTADVKRLWVDAVKANVQIWRKDQS